MIIARHRSPYLHRERRHVRQGRQLRHRGAGIRRQTGVCLCAGWGRERARPHGKPACARRGRGLAWRCLRGTDGEPGGGQVRAGSPMQRLFNASWRGYDRGLLRPRIVHLGLGVFFRAHGALNTEDVLHQRGGDWGIVDTEPLVAFFDRSDRNHRWVAGLPSTGSMTGFRSRLCIRPQRPTQAALATVSCGGKLHSTAIPSGSR